MAFVVQRKPQAFLQFSGVETEIELILARSRIFVKPDTRKSCSSPKPGEKENENWTCKIRAFCFFHNESTRYSRCSFRGKLLKLSTGEIIKTPNVIRTMIPERIVQQYQQYCCETNFEPMSKRTLQRVWAVCSSSVRKSLQGLDNFSASGMEAVDALEKLVDKLVDCGKTQ